MKLNGPLLALLPFSWGLQAPVDLVESRRVFVPSWQVQATTSGPPVIVNGTVEQAHKKVLELNPNYSADGVATLEKRTEFGNALYVCGEPSTRTSIYDVRASISSLRSFRGRPFGKPGPRYCGQVSCLYNTTIWWCNDMPKAKILQSWGSIADGAEYILAKCARNGTLQVSGEARHPSGWGVSVRRNKSSC